MTRRARRASRARTVEPPAPLPPESRTVGQLVAETLRLYGRTPWRAAPRGVPGGGIVRRGDGGGGRHPFLTPAGAGLAGVVAFLPFPLLALAFILPAVAWLALVGLFVPVIVIERTPFRAGFRRAVELGRADYVHALGSLATLAITYFVARLALFFLLRGGSGTAERTAAFLADLVISPLLFLGAALLYFDQAARLR